MSPSLCCHCTFYFCACFKINNLFYNLYNNAFKEVERKRRSSIYLFVILTSFYLPFHVLFICSFGFKLLPNVIFLCQHNFYLLWIIIIKYIIFIPYYSSIIQPYSYCFTRLFFKLLKKGDEICIYIVLNNSIITFTYPSV